MKLLPLLILCGSLAANNIFENKDWWTPYFVSEKEMNWFHSWAFGHSPKAKLTQVERINLWNRQHGHFYLLRPHYSLNKELPIMIKLWRNETEQRMKVFYNCCKKKNYEHRNHDKAQ